MEVLTGTPDHRKNVETTILTSDFKLYSNNALEDLRASTNLSKFLSQKIFETLNIPVEQCQSNE